MADKSTELVTQAYMDQIFISLKEQIADLSEKVSELGSAAASKTRRSSGKKRKPSKYNLFIKKCMKGTGRSMGDCAAAYKEAKADGSLDAQIASVQVEEAEE